MNHTTSAFRCNTPKNAIRRVSVTDTAKLVRKQLKRRFPGCKFSVRSLKYANGASISVVYGPDGPPADEVNAVCKAFQGGRFDGCTDSLGHVDHYMAPGKLPVVAIGFKPSPDAERVRFGADSVFVSKRRAHGSVAVPATTDSVDFDDCPF